MFKHKLRIAFDELIRERNSGGNILLEAVSLLLIGVMLFIVDMNIYNEKTVSNILVSDLDNTGIISIEDDNNYDKYETMEGYERFKKEYMQRFNIFLNELNNYKGIDAAIEYQWSDMSIDLYTDTNGNKVFTQSFNIAEQTYESYTMFTEDEIGRNISTLCVGRDYNKLFKIDVITDYTEDEENEIFSKYTGIIYMGDALEHIEPGTVITSEFGETYIVGGTIKKGDKMPKIEDVSGQATAYEIMDYKILIVRNMIEVPEKICFKLKDGYSMNDLKNEMSILGRKMNYTLAAKNFKVIFDTIGFKNKTFVNYIKQILYIIMITVIVLQVSMQVVHLLENFGNYGILYANGFSAGDHYFIFLIQNILKGIIAFFIALGAGYLILEFMYTDIVSKYTMRILYNVVLKYILWKVALCAFAITIFTAIIAIVLFKRKSPAILIKESKK